MKLVVRLHRKRRRRCSCVRLVEWSVDGDDDEVHVKEISRRVADAYDCITLHTTYWTFQDHGSTVHAHYICYGIMSEPGPSDAPMEVDESYADESRAGGTREGIDDPSVTQQDTEGAFASSERWYRDDWFD